MKSVVIFAIDNGHHLHPQAKFLRHIDTLRSMGKLQAPLMLCIGSWEGQLERSYMLNTADYKSHVRGSGFVASQQSVLVVMQNGRAELFTPGLLTSLDDLGYLRPVPKDQIGSLSGWTYVESEGVYYAAG